jgi:GNAT superfamily N-acetyltransferase
MRAQWPFLYQGAERLTKEPFPPEWNPIHFTVSEEEVLISYASAIPLCLEHRGTSYQAYGLGNVFTAPPFRRAGYGSQVVAAATQYIIESGVDVATLWCDYGRRWFYARNGWRATPWSATRIGCPAAYRNYPGLRMMLFISEKGKQRRRSFALWPIYVPLTWVREGNYLF